MRKIYIVIHTIPGQSTLAVRQYAACGAVCRDVDQAAEMARQISKELGVQAWVLDTVEPKLNAEVEADLRDAQIGRKN